MPSTLTPEILSALRTIQDGGTPPRADQRILVPSWAVQAMNDLVPGAHWRLTAAGTAVVALADERDAEEKGADIHRKLNERVAGALGLLGLRTDPETGKEYLPSWHNMPEQVEALRAERDELRLTLAAEQGKPEGAPSEGWAYTSGFYERWEKGKAVVQNLPPLGWKWRIGRRKFRDAPTARAAMLAADAATAPCAGPAPASTASPPTGT